MGNDQKIAVLVGSNGRLGPTWAECLMQNGYKVFGTGIEEVTVNDFVPAVSYRKLDLRESGTTHIAEVLCETSPQALVLNSGIDSRPGEGKANLQDYSIETWREILEVNLVGVVKVLNTTLEMKLPPKRIVIIGSMYATTAPIPELYSHYGVAGQRKHPAYSASKSAILAVVRQYAIEFVKRNVFVNLLSPGSIKSEQDLEFERKISQRIPIGRMGQASELKSALSFLLDIDNSYFVGQNLIIDGGMNLW